MTQTFNSPWVGALAADLATPGCEMGTGREAGTPAAPSPLRWDLAPQHAGQALPSLRDDPVDEDGPNPDEADVQAAERDVSVYQIGFTLLIGVGVAVGLSTAMLLR